MSMTGIEKRRVRNETEEWLDNMLSSIEREDLEEAVELIKITVEIMCDTEVVENEIS